MNLSPRARFWLAAARGMIVLAFLAVVLSNDKAKAADKGGAPANVFADAPMSPAKSWTGCFIRLHGGMAAMDTKAGLETTPPAPVTIIELDGISATGGLYGAGVGCDAQLGKSGLVIGAFADYSKFGSTEWNLNILPASAAVNFTTGLDHQTSIGLRGGFLVNPKTLIYVLGAWTQLEMNSFAGSVGGVALPGALSFSRFNGWEVGGGMEAAIGAGWSLNVEYRYAAFDGQSIPICTGCGVNLNVDPSVHTARLGVAYRFGFGQ